MVKYLFIMTSLLATGAFASNQKEEAAAGKHVIVAPSAIEWKDGPDSLPKGAKFVLLEGDPSKAGSFTMRLKFPAKYQIPAHWHSKDERITVLTGAFSVGMGDKLDETKGTELPTGSFAIMPKKSHHYAYAGEESIIQLHGEGPWDITYINPADDPRKKQ